VQGPQEQRRVDQDLDHGDGGALRAHGWLPVNAAAPHDKPRSEDELAEEGEDEDHQRSADSTEFKVSKAYPTPAMISRSPTRLGSHPER
jgi:hypothetical protein